MPQLINLHFASEYSFFESPTTIKEYITFAVQNNIDTLVLTDHNYVFGFAEFKKECEKNNIKPIYGIDLDVDNFRLILLAKNIAGFNEILNLSFLLSKKEKISINEINEKNLIIINHPTYGTKDIEKMQNKFKDFYFYEPGNQNSNIFISDNRIVNQEKEDALFFINELREQKLNKFNSYLFNNNPLNIEKKIIDKSNEIASICNVTFNNEENVLPNVYLNVDPNQALLNLIKKGLELHYDKLKFFSKKIIDERIEYEFLIIKKMNVSNYFLIIADLVNWAKNNQIYIGPGRGSVSGSLIAFLLNISTINPLEYNLYFERFLNPDRISMPDIDIDIQDDKREDVINYLKDKYGFNSVAQICTFQRMGAKQSLKDVGRFLNINFSEVNEISKLISGSDSLIDSYKNNTKFRAKIDSSNEYTKLFKLSQQIESLPRQTGTHAAGIVISKKNIIENCPVMNIDGNLVTQFSMEHLEDWNLLKIDLLGLRTLTIIKTIESEIKKTYDKNFSIENIPLNDTKTNSLLTKGKVAGIFQLESSGMTKTIQNVKINNFNDLVDIISLYRPGPLSNIPHYIKNKNHPEEIEYIHPMYNDLIKQTNGIIIYQEQIMEIAKKIANFSFTQADTLRKAISKKNKIEIENLKNLFINNSINNNISKEKSEQIYKQIEKFAEYGFNKSHAVAYATLSYKMAYLKTKFPICFYSVLISLVASMDAVNKYVIEARELKFNIESPSINKISNNILHNKVNTIWLPLTFIKGLGFAAFEKILQEFESNGEFKSFFNFIVRMKKNNINDLIIDALIFSNSLREFANMETLIHNKEKALNYSSVALIKEEGNIKIDWDVLEPKLEFVEQNLEFESKSEIKYLGMIYNAFITSKYELNNGDKLINLKIGIEYIIPVYINNKKEMLNKYKTTSYIIEISDSSTQETIFFNERNKNIFDEIKNNTLGYMKIIKIDKNGKKYLNVIDWKEIK